MAKKATKSSKGAGTKPAPITGADAEANYKVGKKHPGKVSGPDWKDHE